MSSFCKHSKCSKKSLFTFVNSIFVMDSHNIFCVISFATVSVFLLSVNLKLKVTFYSLTSYTTCASEIDLSSAPVYFLSNKNFVSFNVKFILDTISSRSINFTFLLKLSGNHLFLNNPQVPIIAI